MRKGRNDAANACQFAAKKYGGVEKAYRLAVECRQKNTYGSNQGHSGRDSCPKGEETVAAASYPQRYYPRLTVAAASYMYFLGPSGTGKSCTVNYYIIISYGPMITVV